MQRKVDPDGRILMWLRKCAGYSTVSVHQRFFTVCRLSDSREMYNSGQSI